MTNDDKQDLIYYCRNGISFDGIRKLVDCADSTIKRYIEVFGKESTDKMNKVIAQLKLKGFKQDKNKHNRYCTDALCATFNFQAEYICYGRIDSNLKEGIHVTNFTVEQILIRMYFKAGF
jgi:hypothetical protein